MKYSYIIQFTDGTYYKSKHEYISADFAKVKDEIDTTPMTEDDLLYLIENNDICDYDTVWVCLGINRIGSIKVVDLKESLR